MTAGDYGRSVGMELCSNLIRGVLLGDEDAEIARAAEVSVTSFDDDRSVLDAMIRLRADLGVEHVPARLATFPAGSWLRRIDVTGKTGPELNALRGEIDDRYRAGSTMLVDDGPRRWLLIIHWPDAGVRRIEALTEQAGFIDVAVEPSPVALARVLPPSLTVAERFAAPGEATALVVHDNVPIAAVSIDGTGVPSPTLAAAAALYSIAIFDDATAADSLAELIENVRRSTPLTPPDSDDHWAVRVDGSDVAAFPPHDLRSPERQCVALGAAVAAAGLDGTIRPVDIITDAAAAEPLQHRPWVIERASTVAPEVSSGPGPTRRRLARLIPRLKR